MLLLLWLLLCPSSIFMPLTMVLANDSKSLFYILCTPRLFKNVSITYPIATCIGLTCILVFYSPMTPHLLDLVGSAFWSSGFSYRMELLEWVQKQALSLQALRSWISRQLLNVHFLVSCKMRLLLRPTSYSPWEG